MTVAHRQREIDDGQESKYERLHGADEEVEKLNEERDDGGGKRQVERPDRDVLRDDRGNDDEQQLADENIEEQTRGEGERARAFLDEIDRKQPPEGLNQMRQVRAEKQHPRRQPHHNRQRDRRVGVGRRRSAER